MGAGWKTLDPTQPIDPMNLGIMSSWPDQRLRGPGVYLDVLWGSKGIETSSRVVIRIFRASIAVYLHRMRVST